MTDWEDQINKDKKMSKFDEVEKVRELINDPEMMERFERAEPARILADEIQKKLGHFFNERYSEICKALDKDPTLRQKLGTEFVSELFSTMSMIIAPGLQGLDNIIDKPDEALEDFFVGLRNTIQMIRKVKNTPEFMSELNKLKH